MTTPDTSVGRPGRSLALLAILALAVAGTVAAAYWPVLSARATSFDDDVYLRENPGLQNPGWHSFYGFITGVKTSTRQGFYEPLALTSLMLDAALGGRFDNLRPFHRTALTLHVINAVLVVGLLYLLFGHPGVAAMGGVLFGVHPLAVEPLCWTSERGTVLATTFVLGSLLLYVAYVRRGHWLFYAGCGLAYLLALGAKPISLPLPVFLLLLDLWPMRCWSRRTLVQKWPLLVMGALFTVVTCLSRTTPAGAAPSGDHLLSTSLLILCHDVIFYLYKVLWPTNISAYHAFPAPMSLSNARLWVAVMGTGVLIPALLISLRWTRALTVGWLFFFAAILATIQISGPIATIASDKYAYLAGLGVLLPFTRLLQRIWDGSPAIMTSVSQRLALTASVLALAVLFTWSTRYYLACWQDTETLYRYMLSGAPTVPVLHNNYGAILSREGKLDEAIIQYRRALQLKPDDPGANNNLGTLLLYRGHVDQAMTHFETALRQAPDWAIAHNNLGIALARKGKTPDAIRHYERALELQPGWADAYHNLAKALADQGKTAEAIGYYRKAIAIRPDLAAPRCMLAALLARQGQLDEAITLYQEVIRIDFRHREARAGLDSLMRRKQLQRGRTSAPASRGVL